MVGNRLRGQRAAATNRKRYGDDFYRKIGSLGGQKNNTGGFAANRELAKAAGAKGGRISRRTGVTNGAGKRVEYIARVGEPLWEDVNEA